MIRGSTAEPFRNFCCGFSWAACWAFFTGVAGAAGVAETVRQALDRVLAVCAPWGIVGSAVVLLGAGWYLYAAAKRRFAAWDGEDEDAMDAAEQQLSWALLLTGLVIILDFFFFAASIIYDRFLPDLILFLASVAVLVVLQAEASWTWSAGSIRRSGAAFTT